MTVEIKKINQEWRIHVPEDPVATAMLGGYNDFSDRRAAGNYAFCEMVERSIAGCIKFLNAAGVCTNMVQVE